MAKKKEQLELPLEEPAPEEQPATEAVVDSKTTKAWENLVKLLDTNDKKGLLDLKLEGKHTVQEGVTVEEVKKQILQLAPGPHTSLNGLILDLIEKLPG